MFKRLFVQSHGDLAVIQFIILALGLVQIAQNVVFVSHQDCVVQLHLLLLFVHLSDVGHDVVDSILLLYMQFLDIVQMKLVVILHFVQLFKQFYLFSLVRDFDLTDRVCGLDLDVIFAVFQRVCFLLLGLYLVACKSQLSLYLQQFTLQLRYLRILLVVNGEVLVHFGRFGFPNFTDFVFKGLNFIFEFVYLVVLLLQCHFIGCVHR